ncbi:N-6 DNA methylase (plasmid) [Rhodococcus aetherivorans]|nr:MULTISPECIES: N-6 DNA methylase [Rhodococcus]WKX02143.1 N-6 DNA methylase [Rhodococcus aetherivorans]
MSEVIDGVATLSDLACLSAALVGDVSRLMTADEAALVPSDVAVSARLIDEVRGLIEDGGDPLGAMYCSIRSREDRRPLGQTYTPAPIVEAMVKWARQQGEPARIVDPGSGSGRYLLAAAAAFPEAEVIAVEVDPLSALMVRANIAVRGLGDRASVYFGDYRSLSLPEIDGSTLFIGNPPYVRHHQIESEWKAWLTRTAKARGFKASALAGLHVHFFLATAELGRPGDRGAFITSSEWLDVNYGSLVRQLLLDGLGGESLHVIDPKVEPFADATTTGAITTFKIGSAPTSMRVRRVDEVSDLGNLAGGRKIGRERLAESNRWSVLTRVTPKVPAGYVELGELCRVHRGAVTGSNATWVKTRDGLSLPERVLFPSVTKAKELFGAGEQLSDTVGLRVVIDLPTELDEFEGDERKGIDRFLRAAKSDGVHEGYIASKRRAWWSVGLRAPAPILATYMARRPPAFVRNLAGARHINIAHGLYPRQELSNELLDRLGDYLRTRVSLDQGRVYAGGLTKFEPKEMERIVVPGLELLQSGVIE